MTRLTTVLCVCAFFVPLAAAQLLERTDPAQAGFDEARLNRIDEVIEEAIDAREIPGAVAMVIRDGAIVYYRSFGFADVDTREPMQEDSIFRIASMTKAITTVGVMILYERGHFLLADPVSDYIPEFSNPRIVVNPNLD